VKIKKKQKTKKKTKKKKKKNKKKKTSPKYVGLTQHILARTINAADLSFISFSFTQITIKDFTTSEQEAIRKGKETFDISGCEEEAQCGVWVVNMLFMVFIT
jgi:hypothetical protein